MDGLFLKAVLFDIFLYLFMVIVIIERGSLLGFLRPAVQLELIRGILAMLLFDEISYICQVCAVLIAMESLFEVLGTEIDSRHSCHVDQIK